MKHTRLIICIGVLLTAIGLKTGSGKDAPNSAEQLRSDVESALKAQNAKALIALYNWDEVQEKNDVNMLMKMALDEMWKGTNKIISVKLSPLPARYKATNEIFSLRTRDNVTVMGMIDLEYSDSSIDGILQVLSHLVNWADPNRSPNSETVGTSSPCE